MPNCIYTPTDKVLLRVCLLLFRLTLDFMYLYILQIEYPNIQLLSFGYRNGAFAFVFTPLKVIVSYILTFLFIEIVLKYCVRNDRPHELICMGLFAVSVLPNLSMFAYSNIGWSFIAGLTLFWILFFMLTDWFTKSVPSNLYRNYTLIFKGAIAKKHARFLCVLIFVLSAVGSILFCYEFHGQFYIHIDFSNDYVYKSRIFARHNLSQFANYFRNTSMYIVIPLLANICLIKKKFLLLGFSLLILALLFSVDAQKAVLMLPFVSLTGALIINKKISITMIKGLLSINIFVIIFYILTKNILFIKYLVERIYFIPAIMGRCYFDIVNENGYMLFMTSLLRKYGLLNNYAYDQYPLPYMIGGKFFGSYNISANTGGFAAAYAYGPVAMFAIILCYAYLFRLFDKYTTNINIKYYFAFIATMIFVIEGASIISVTIVYGYLFGLFLLYIMNNSLLFINKPAMEEK